MATAERRWTLFPAIVALVLGSVAFSWWHWGAAEAASKPSTVEPAPLAVTAQSTYQFASLQEMLEGSDAVVVGVVQATNRGRLVGDPDDGGVISRVITVRVEQVLSMSAETVSEVLLIEEEGWLPDGTPIEVNGVPASEVGDRGLWFLDQVATDDVSTMVVINSQGRFLDTVDGTAGGDQSDALVRLLQQRPFEQLVELTISLTKET